VRPFKKSNFENGAARRKERVKMERNGVAGDVQGGEKC